ncbi:hypothetical protein L916_21772 [Phytophthora nicotianae]|uniref:Uncharacterized protein n=1 Tax=Phytophthora nicotianae TaxID=4792 RepID=W2HSQ3_PHYNI|nr:hypothetical protein L916_21772 [Phytophthora nicotianae]
MEDQAVACALSRKANLLHERHKLREEDIALPEIDALLPLSTAEVDSSSSVNPLPYSLTSSYHSSG